MADALGILETTGLTGIIAGGDAMPVGSAQTLHQRLDKVFGDQRDGNVPLAEVGEHHCDDLAAYVEMVQAHLWQEMVAG